MIETKIRDYFDKNFSCNPIIPSNAFEFENSLVLASDMLRELKIKTLPLSMGLAIFKSHPLSHLLELNKDRVKNSMILNEKSSFLFTCNRQLFNRGVLKKKGNGPVFLAMNEKKEILGIANRLKSGIENKFNIGSYLDEDNLDFPKV